MKKAKRGRQTIGWIVAGFATALPGAIFDSKISAEKAAVLLVAGGGGDGKAEHLIALHCPDPRHAAPREEGPSLHHRP